MSKNKDLRKYLVLLLTFVFPLTLVTPTQAEFQPFIVGGTNVSSWSDYPFQVGLVSKTLANFDNGAFEEQFCGGVLINEYWVLTAAHCVTLTDQDSGTFSQIASSSLGVIGGKLLLTDYRSPDVSDVSAIFVHPDAALFDQGTGAGINRYLLVFNDIALLQISASPTGSIPLTDLGKVTSEAANFPSRITGWGKSQESPDVFPDALQVGNVAVVENSTCLTIYGGLFRADTQICAQGGTTGSRVDVCSGDSGGPLVSTQTINSVTTYESLTGLTSYGKLPCSADAPGVFTRVSAFLSWIDGELAVGDLSSLTSSEFSFAESFSASRTSYSASVAHTVSATTISATAAQVGSTVALFRGATGSTVFDGNLSFGVNTIRAVVSSSNGPAKSYSMTITRAAPPPPPSSGGGAPAAAAVVVAPVVSTLQPGARVTGTKWNVVTGTDGVTRARVSVGTQFRGKNAVFFKRLKNGRLIRVSTGRIGRAGRVNLQTRVKFREGQKIRVQVDGRFRSTITIRN